MATRNNDDTQTGTETRLPHIFVLLALVIVAVGLSSWFVPSGTFKRAPSTVNGSKRTVVVPGTYQSLDKERSVDALFEVKDVPEGSVAPVGLVGILSAIPRGMSSSAEIIFFIFIIGGAFTVLQRTQALTAAVAALVRRFSERLTLLIAVLSFAFGVGGSTIGMGEELIPLIPIFLVLSTRLGFDRVFGIAIVLVPSGIGFAASTTNPFTVNVAQSIAELPLNSGLGLRIGFFLVAMTLTVVHLHRYTKRLRADPNNSVLTGLPPTKVELMAGSEQEDDSPPAFHARHIAILATSGILFAGIVVAVQVQGWWMARMSGGFLLMGVVAGLMGGLSSNQIAEAFADGMRDIAVAALVVGVARGVVVVMTDAMILDSLIHGAATVLDGNSPHVAAQGMFGFQTVLNFFIPSGSGQAAVTMPIMAPLADLVGVTRQTSVLAFQFGDGLSNLIIPTSGALMAMLLMGRIPFTRWVRFIWPLIVQLIVLAACTLWLAVTIGYH